MSIAWVWEEFVFAASREIDGWMYYDDEGTCSNLVRLACSAPKKEIANNKGSNEN